MRKVSVSFRMDADLYQKYLEGKKSNADILNPIIRTYSEYNSNLVEINEKLSKLIPGQSAANAEDNHRTEIKPHRRHQPKVEKNSGNVTHGLHPIAAKFAADLAAKNMVLDPEPSPESLEEDRKELEKRDKYIEFLQNQEDDKDITPLFHSSGAKDD